MGKHLAVSYKVFIFTYKLKHIEMKKDDYISANEYFGVPRVDREDVIEVAKGINQTLTDVEIEWVRLCYEDAQRQDPTGTWNLIVEDLIYQIPRIKEL